MTIFIIVGLILVIITMLVEKVDFCFETGHGCGPMLLLLLAWFGYAVVGVAWILQHLRWVP